MSGDLEPILAAATAWARDDARIEALVPVGSHARGAARPDSDVDLLALTSEPEAFLVGTGWLARFGGIARIDTETWGMRVLFDRSGVLRALARAHRPLPDQPTRRR